MSDESKNILLREMVLEDIAPVFLLGEQLFSAEKWPALYRSWDEYEIVERFVSDGDLCYVAEDEETKKITGFALGTLVEKRRSAWSYGYILWIGIDMQYAGSGIGERLLKKITSVFIEKGARMLIADTAADNLKALRFFHNNGFEDQIDHVYLSKNLTSHPEYQRKIKKS